MSIVKETVWSIIDTFTHGPTHKQGLQKSNIFHLFGRFVQIVMACVVIGYYGSDLHKARHEHKYSDSKWVFAVVVGSMAAISALILMIISAISQYATTALFFAWDWIMVILWAAVGGLFGNMYFGENAEMDSGIQAMKTAAAFDLVNLVLWFISAAAATFVFFRTPRRSLHTGRATL